MEISLVWRAKTVIVLVLFPTEKTQLLRLLPFSSFGHHLMETVCKSILTYSLQMPDWGFGISNVQNPSHENYKPVMSATQMLEVRKYPLS